MATLRDSVKGVVTEHGDAGHDVSRWAQNAQKPAKYVVSPIDAEDISKAVLFARAHKLPIVAVCGGHNTTGASSTDGGIVVNMRSMNAIRVDQANKVMYIQGGAVWKEVNPETIKYGLAATTGFCPTVGIGGHATQGGLGFLAGERGLSVDNVISATVVLANGDIVQASAIDNPDLFWGIRGGGPNFGIVAEFVMKLYPQRADVFWTTCFFPPRQLPSIVPTIKKWTETQKPHQGLLLSPTRTSDDSYAIVIIGWSNSSREEGELCFKPIYDLRPDKVISDQTKFERLTDNFQPPGDDKGCKVCVGAYIDTFDVETVQKVCEEWDSTKSHSLLVYEFFHYEKLSSVPVDATPFCYRSKNISVLCTIFWSEPEKLPWAHEAALKLKSVVASSSSMVVGGSLGYPNYADIFAQGDNAKILFGPNYARLQQVKRKYDPDNIWKQWFPIQPAA